MKSENLLTQRIDTPRPVELAGWTWCVKFENLKLFVTINHDGEKILEVFVTEMLSNGIGLLASKMLQSGCFSVNEVARSLRKINGIHAVSFNGKIVNSPEQAVAECLLIAEVRLSENLSAKTTEVK